MDKTSAHKARYDRYKGLVETKLSGVVEGLVPRSLYTPLSYVLAGGGKRIRPVLLMLSCEAVGSNARRALNAGAAIEILHNFTLVHDDIMDNASSRRGRKTVHTRWDTNVAILVGDELLALAYRVLLQITSPNIQEIVKTFTDGVVEVCEGQAYDKDFETRSRVSVNEYLLMIQKKTAKMVSVAAEIGALIGGGSRKEVLALRRYGHHVGLAFQIQDDLLDIMADEAEFGKKIGGDLVEGKKTFLLIEALRTARGHDKRVLEDLIARKGCSPRRIPEYRRVYINTGAVAAAHRRIEYEIGRSKDELRRLPSTHAKAVLAWFTDMLLHRTY